VNPDFIAIAKGYHIKANQVTERSQLESAVKEMMESDEAFFLEVKVEQEENVFPMIPTGASVSEILLE
jgi:acetolactate synthase-1/2/3 large subunit